MVNYTLVFVATIVQFILGALWYSPFMFGKWWMEIMECTSLSKEELKKMQKEMMPFYVLQFFLTLFVTVSLANLTVYLTAFSIYHLAFWIWIGFLVPVEISSVIWANTKKKFWFKQILIMISSQIIFLMVASWILSM